MQLWPTTEGFCFLTEVSGKFRGLGEAVMLDVRDGHWWLGGRSLQIDVRAVARCVTWASFYGIGTPVINNPAGTSVESVNGVASQMPLAFPRQFTILSGVSGKFQGGGETAQVWAPPSKLNEWRVGASSLQRDHPVRTQAISISLGTSGNVRVLRHATWGQGEGPIELLGASAGVCYLAGMEGRFEGGGEAVRITEEGGRWLLHGMSSQEGVRAYAYCLAYDQSGSPRRRPEREGCFPENFTYCVDCGVERATRTRAGCTWEEVLNALEQTNIGCAISQGVCRQPEAPCPDGEPVHIVEMCCQETGTTFYGIGCTEEEAEENATRQDTACAMTTGICPLR